MKIFVTGATGFVGRYVVDALRDRNHEVVALVRGDVPPTGWPWSARDGVETVVGDLNGGGPWRAALGSCEAIVHLAAAKEGDLAARFAGTVVGTERLLAAAASHGIYRLVHISTFSVYDYERQPRNRVITEASPLEHQPERRDPYAETKLVQERLVDEFRDAGGAVTIIRPGFVWGAEDLWDGGVVVGARSVGLLFSPMSPFKLVYVENVAEAIALAVDVPAAVGEVFNVVDDEQPSMWAFSRALREAGADLPRPIPVPWAIAFGLALAVERVNRRFLKGRARLPGYLVPAKVAARSKPHPASNRHARDVLGWTPRYGFQAAVARSFALRGDAERSADPADPTLR